MKLVALGPGGKFPACFPLHFAGASLKQCRSFDELDACGEVFPCISRGPH